MEHLLAIQEEIKAMMEACLEMLEASQKKSEINQRHIQKGRRARGRPIKEKIETVIEDYEGAPRI